jgi:hypothetical protein
MGMTRLTPQQRAWAREQFGVALPRVIRSDDPSSRRISIETWRLEEHAKPSTVNYELAMLRRAFRLAARAGKVAALPRSADVLAKAISQPETTRDEIKMTRRLGEFCEFIIDCEHKTAPTQEIGYPSIRTPNIGRGHFILENVNRRIRGNLSSLDKACSTTTGRPYYGARSAGR